MRRSCWFYWLLGLTACTASTAAPEQKEAAERSLLAPYLTGDIVECETLRVELTADFHPNVGDLAAGAERTMRREAGDGFVDVVWTNLPGAPPMQVLVGEPMQFTGTGATPGRATIFRVARQFVRRVYAGTHPLALSASATHAVLRRSGAAPVELGEYHIADGAARRR